MASLIAGVALSGCSGVGEGGADRAAQQSGISASGSASPAMSGANAPDPSQPPASTGPGATPTPSRGIGASGEVTVSGAVEAGVETNCLLLRAPGTLYLLIGGDRSKLAVGRQVTVRGQVDPTLISTCQQGTPLRVSDIQAG